MMKDRKKILFLLCAVALVFLSSCGNGGSAEAGDEPENANDGDIGNFTYSVKADGNVVITGLTDKGRAAEELSIPRKVACGLFEKSAGTVDEIAEGAFANATKVRRVLVSDDVVKIGRRAFKDCLSMQSVTLSKRLAEIEEETFSGCSALSGIVIPSSVRKIGRKAFADCVNIAEVTVFKDVECAADSFDASVALKRIDNPKDVYVYERKHGTVFLTGIRDAFRNEQCFEIPEEIDGNAVGALEGTFYGNDKVRKIVIHDNIQFIHIDTFTNCTSLEEVVMPSKFDSPDEKFYGYFHSLEAQTFMNCTSLKSIVIPEGVEVISVNAFLNCTALEEVRLPSSLKEIRSSAFANCSSLERIEFPNGLEEMWNAVFADCTALEEVVLPESMKSVGHEAFFGCMSLKRVVMPVNSDDGEIQASLFDHCGSLEEVVLPQSTKRIGRRAFYGCAKLELAIPSAVEEIECNAFYGCDKMKDAVLPHGLKSIGCTSFSGCDRGNCKHIESVFFNCGMSDGVVRNFSLDDLTYDGTSGEWEAVDGHGAYSGVKFGR